MVLLSVSVLFDKFYVQCVCNYVQGKAHSSLGCSCRPVYLASVNCTGKESDLRHCEMSPWGSHNCQQGDQAGVVCETGKRLSLLSFCNFLSMVHTHTSICLYLHTGTNINRCAPPTPLQHARTHMHAQRKSETESDK